MQGAGVTADAAWEQVLVAREPSSRGPAGNAGQGGTGHTKDALSLDAKPHACHRCACKKGPPAEALLWLVPSTEHVARTAFDRREVCNCLCVSHILILGG